MQKEDLLHIFKQKLFLGDFAYVIAEKSHQDGGKDFHAILLNASKKKFAY